MFNRFRVLAAYFFAIPLALILGFLAASPDQMTFMLVGILLFCLSLPLLVKWHHALLIVCWNSAFGFFFLPGEPNFSLLAAGLSFGVSLLNYIMGRRPFLPAPEMKRPLLFMGAVVLCTAWYRGGIGIKSLGGAAHGGRNYIYIFGAVVGYFALTAAPIPIRKAQKTIALFFLSGITYVLSNLAYTLGPAYYALFYIVPSGFAVDQAANDYGAATSDRIQGLGPACTALFCFLLGHYGIRGLFNWVRPWRFIILCLVLVTSFFAGFRSILALLFLIFVFQFYLEGLFRTRLFLVVMGLFVCGSISVLLFSSKLPLAAQRAISFLPVTVDAGVRADAAGSTDWRIQMWAVVWNDVPKYLIIGKGYSIDPLEMYLTREAIRMGLLGSAEESMLAGDYHSGPLSVLIPFGIMGCVAFLWVLAAGFRVLYSNYQYGDEELRRVNTVLLSYYLAFAFAFFFIFGAFNSELYYFLGPVGLSVSLNGGVKRKFGTSPQRIRGSISRAFAIETG